MCSYVCPYHAATVGPHCCTHQRPDVRSGVEPEQLRCPTLGAAAAEQPEARLVGGRRQRGRAPCCRPYDAASIPPTSSRSGAVMSLYARISRPSQHRTGSVGCTLMQTGCLRNVAKRGRCNFRAPALAARAERTSFGVSKEVYEQLVLQLAMHVCAPTRWQKRRGGSRHRKDTCWRGWRLPGANQSTAPCRHRSPRSRPAARRLRRTRQR